MLYKPEPFLLTLQEDPTSEIVPLGRDFYKVPKFNVGEPEGLKTISDNAELNKFFNKLVAEAARILDADVDSLDKDWLAQLLTRFHKRKEFLDLVESDDANDEKDEANYRYLVDMAIQAMEAKEIAQRGIRLLKIGDQALFSAGFFPERIVRQMGTEGINYYENMSRTSYSQAADVMRADFIKRMAYQVDIFRQLFRCIATAAKKDRQPYAELMLEHGRAQPIMAH